jgi:hypothetical protein
MDENEELKDMIRYNVLCDPHRPVAQRPPDAFTLWWKDNIRCLRKECPQNVDVKDFAFHIWMKELPYDYKISYIEKEKELLEKNAVNVVKDSDWCKKKEKEYYEEYGII